MLKKLSFTLIGWLAIFSNCNNSEPPMPEKVMDIDGNVYETVTIGKQTWLKENLKVTHYNNGDVIPNIIDHTEWVNQVNGALCDYDNDAHYSAIYGKLYNFYVTLDSRKVCPTGWHVPSDAEWTILTDTLGGVFIAGSRMKETGTAHWHEPNSGASNKSGFTALPSGYRDYGFFSDTIGDDCYWWSSTEEVESETAWYRNLFYDQIGGAYSGYAGEKGGFSIRCLKD